MYSKIETGLSRGFLNTLLKSMPQPYCLIGGWSVFLLVNDAFNRATGKTYLGSKDIDLGFQLDPNWKENQFNNSPFRNAIIKIQELGFEAESFRFVRRFHASNGRALTEEEGRHLPLYEIFNLYIDILVDSKDPERFKAAKFSVLDEPLLSRLFAGGEQVAKRLDGLNVVVPHPQLQMEMKYRSFPNRTQDDKKTKDLIDLCALVLYSGLKPPVIRDMDAKARYKGALEATSEPEWTNVSTALDITVQQAKRAARVIQ